MTQEQTALHERFLKGITLKMLGYGTFGLITVVSSFWTGYGALKDSIHENDIRCDRRIMEVIYAFKKSNDSTQNLNERQFQTLWDAIKKPEIKVIYRNISHTQEYVTEHRDPVTGEISFIKK